MISCNHAVTKIISIEKLLYRTEMLLVMAISWILYFFFSPPYSIMSLTIHNPGCSALGTDAAGYWCPAMPMLCWPRAAGPARPGVARLRGALLRVAGHIHARGSLNHVGFRAQKNITQFSEHGLFNYTLITRK